jgi:hypothetical protein
MLITSSDFTKWFVTYKYIINMMNTGGLNSFTLIDSSGVESYGWSSPLNSAADPHIKFKLNAGGADVTFYKEAED